MNHNNNFAVLRDDPAALLQLFDPATVAIRAGTDRRTLEQMSSFADSLVRYLSLVRSQQQQRQQQQQQQQQQQTAPPAAANHGNASAAAAALPQQQHEHQEPFADAVASHADAVAAAPAQPPGPPINAPAVVVKQEPEESMPNPSAPTQQLEQEIQHDHQHEQQPEQQHEHQQLQQQEHPQNATLAAAVQVKQEPETETDTITEPPTPEEVPSLAPTDTSTETNDNEEEGGQEGEPDGSNELDGQNQDAQGGYGPPTEEAEEALEEEGQAYHSHQNGQEMRENNEADNAAGVGIMAPARNNDGEEAAPSSEDEALVRRRSGRQHKPKTFYPCEGRVSLIVDLYATGGANEETDDEEKSRKLASRAESHLGGMPSLRQPASLKRRAVSPARLTMEEEVKEEKPAPTKKKPKVDKKIKKEEAGNEEEKIPATKISPTVVGIKDTVMRRSAGNTREFLNKHLVELGLSCFGQGVVSGKQGKISHLTLSMSWNDLPKNEDGKLYWYLGEGERRLRLAQPLNPAENEQTALPIFWAEKAKQKGGSLCFYVGHFKCVRFEKYSTENRVVYKHGAQAKLEFEFIRFDEDLAMKLENVAALSNPTTI